jgi:NADH-quinone oxidoreductase subunit K
MATLNDYLLVSGLLFAIGLAGVVLRRNIIVVAFSRFNTINGLPDYNGQMLVFFVITVAAAEVAVGLAIIVALYRARQTIHTDELTSLKG